MEAIKIGYTQAEFLEKYGNPVAEAEAETGNRLWHGTRSGKKLRAIYLKRQGMPFDTFKAQIDAWLTEWILPKPKGHQYPCAAWLAERSCATCRGIADEHNAEMAARHEGDSP